MIGRHLVLTNKANMIEDIKYIKNKIDSLTYQNDELKCCYNLLQLANRRYKQIKKEQTGK